MKVVYPVIFTELKDEEDTILIEVPDLEIFTQGFGIENAIGMARDAIGIVCIDCEDEKKELPKPTEIRKIDVSSGEFAKDGEGFVSLVDVDLEEYRKSLH